MPPTLELLAPVGSMDALKAALSAGADAVYLGGALFGARASAGFDEQTLRDAINLAHLAGRRVHVTVNTLCFENELSAVLKTLETLEKMHADAVLVQDVGVLSLCLEHFPSLPVHASTQMALHNAQGARFLQSLGVKRIVLARECTLPEIRDVARTGIETEVFAHGALCVCVSGQCLFSSLVGGRSGNRGRCAQPCRLPYEYRGRTAAWLSPADLCARDDLPALIDAGVASLKLEGRLKRPEYVYVVTSAYRRALDAALEGRFQKADAKEREALTQIFSRGAFTRGYAQGAQDAGILYPARTTPVGLSLGRVKDVYKIADVPLCRAALFKPLHNGDGLEIGGQSVIYSGPDVSENCLAQLRLHSPAQIGDEVLRTDDEKQLSAARSAYEGNALFEHIAMPFSAYLNAEPGVASKLRVMCGSISAEVSGDLTQRADNKPLTEETALKALEKTGGTPFYLDSLSFSGTQAFLPAASLNALRRDALSALSGALIAARERAIPKREPFLLPDSASFLGAPRVLVRTEILSEIPALLAGGAECVLYSPPDYREPFLSDALKTLPKNCVLCLPPVCEGKTLDMIIACAKKAGVRMCLGSVGQLGANIETPFLCDFGVPVTNNQSERFLAARGACGITLSPELSLENLRALPAPKAERILTVYGRARLMLLTHCPERVMRGLETGHECCALCEQGAGARGQTLTDRRGFVYPLSPFRLPEGCRVRVLNALPTHLLARAEALRALRVSILLDFSTESTEERLALLSVYRRALVGLPFDAPKVRGTQGRLADGVL